MFHIMVLGHCLIISEYLTGADSDVEKVNDLTSDLDLEVEQLGTVADHVHSKVASLRIVQRHNSLTGVQCLNT